MNNAIKRITLDVQQMYAKDVVQVKKNDTGRRLIFYLVDGGMPYHMTSECQAVFTATKPDGATVVLPCGIEGSSASLEITAQVSELVGRIPCEIKVYGSENKQLTTARFAVSCEDTLYEVGDDVEIPEGQPMNFLLAPDNPEVGKTVRIKAVGEDGRSVVLEAVDPASGPAGPQGEKGDPGQQGPQGDPGADGRTPVKGVDYFTEADKADMVKQVKESGKFITGYGELEGISFDGDRFIVTLENGDDKELASYNDVLELEKAIPKWKLLNTVAIDEAVAQVHISQDSNGNPISAKELRVIYMPGYTDTAYSVYISGPSVSGRPGVAIPAGAGSQTPVIARFDSLGGYIGKNGAAMYTYAYGYVATDVPAVAAVTEVFASSNYWTVGAVIPAGSKFFVFGR